MPPLSTARMLHALLLAGILAGCADSDPPPPPASFSRPARVAFACLDLSSAQPTTAPRHCCALTTNSLGVPTATDEACEEDSDGSKYVLHALVTQTSTGEVAAVDLESEVVKDSRPDIPGYTFVPTGELPTAIVVGQASKRHTYVANAGSADITVLDTASLRSLEPGQLARGQRDPLKLHARPLDMVVHTRNLAAAGETPELEDRLIVSLPGTGELVVVPVRNADEAGTINKYDERIIALSNTLAAPTPGGSSSYEFHHDTGSVEGPECSEYVLRPLSSEPLAVPDISVFEGEMPEPGRMVIDAHCPPTEPDCEPRLLVSDQRLPIIHVLSLGDEITELAPIATGTPTSEVVVTPYVPVGAPGSPDEGETTQYVYALDATDGSVLALEDGNIQRVSADPLGRADRLPIRMSYASGPAVATTLEVVYPDYVPGAEGFVPYLPRKAPLDSEAGQEDCFGANSDGQSPRRLRGVFLAVGLADGTLQMVDIHDRELAACSACPIAVRRHAPRIEIGYRWADIEAADIPDVIGRAVVTTPTFSFDTQVLRVRSDGTTFDSRIGGLACIDCGDDKYRAFPSADDLASDSDAEATQDPEGEGDINSLQPCPQGEALICAEADPWSAGAESWTAVYEGVLPGSLGGAGQFGEDGGGPWLDVEVDPCAVGALGGDAAEFGEGDQLIVRGSLPPDARWDNLPARTRTACEVLAATLDSEPESRIAFRITSAEQRDAGGRLRLAPYLLDPITGVSSGESNASRGPTAGGTDIEEWALINACFAGDPIAYDIRARGGYLVSGGRSGFSHRTVAGTDGRCVLDPEADVRNGGRAWPGELFENHSVRFQVANRPPREGLVRLSFLVQDLAPKAVFDGGNVVSQRLDGVLPEDLRYNPLDQQLYMVDIHQRGLVPIDLDPLPVAVSSSADYE